jgi:hypothetical protein
MCALYNRWQECSGREQVVLVNPAAYKKIILVRSPFREGSNMSAQTHEATASVIAFAPKKPASEATLVTDGGGHGIIALVQKAADLAKADCKRALDLAHRLSSELRVTEERAREFEGQANYFRDRAARAEEWLIRIHSEVQQTFFQNKDQRQHPAPGKKMGL